MIEDRSRSAELAFGSRGVLAGFIRSIPVALSVLAVGTVYGVLAHRAGLSAWHTFLMSGLVFAGASQLIALQLWAHPLPVLAIVFTTLVINLRHLLMGAALQPWFSGLTRVQAYFSVFFMVDESWALTIGELSGGSRNGAFLLGSGLATYVAWLSGAVLGYTVGSNLGNLAHFGLDFAFTAVFLALLVSLWSGKSNLLPWGIAAGVSILSAHFIPGTWYILLGALGGSMIGALRRVQ